MQKFWILIGVLGLAGCTTVQETARAIVSDPNAQAIVPAAVKVAVLTNPELAVAATSVIAIIGAVTAVVKAFKKVK
jgi:hypothetical protein